MLCIIGAMLWRPLHSPGVTEVRGHSMEVQLVCFPFIYFINYKIYNDDDNWIQGFENADHIFKTELLPPLLDFNSPISFCSSLSSPCLPCDTSPPSPPETPSPSTNAVWQRSQLGRIKLIPDSRFWF